ncbi:MAG: hypothetical protein IT364_10010 [Candidatus Hydrogenedentes bacterium]|nr:hypothetical protein [Candidatus Hydrogenedentota bacterium]
MSIAGVAIVLAVLVGSADQALEGPVTFSLVPVQATKENRPAGEKSFGEGLESFRTSLEKLPFDTFKKVKSDKASATANKEARVPISARYTLTVTPLAKDGEGRVRVKVCVEEKAEREGKKVVRKAVDTTAALVPGEHLLLGGPSMDEGRLVIFIAVEKEK